MSVKVKSGLDQTARAIRIGRNLAFRIANEPKEHGFIISPSGDVITKLGSDEETHITFTDEQANMIENNIIIHNHPIEQSFSGGDMIAASNANSIWVATPKRLESFRWNTKAPRSEREKYRSEFKEAWNNVCKRAYEVRDKMYPVSILKDSDGRAKDAFRNADGTVNKAKVDAWVQERKDAIPIIRNRLWRNWIRKNQKKYGYTFSSVGWTNEQKKYN